MPLFCCVVHVAAVAFANRDDDNSHNLVLYLIDSLYLRIRSLPL